MSWLKASGKRGDWTKAKKGENPSGWTNNENQKPFETLLKAKPDKFFTPAPKKW